MILFFLVVFGKFVSIVECQSNLNSTKLHMHLFSNYKNELLPTADLPTPLKVDVEFYIASLHSINEVDETFSMMTGLVMYWTDPNLVWEPNSFVL